MATRRRISPTALLILKVLAATSGAVALITLPGLAVALQPFLNNPKKRHRLHQTINRLEQRKLISSSGKGENRRIVITKRGKQFLSEQEIWDSTLEKPKKWDGKWRVVMFDFPKRFERGRKIFRLKLIDWGFVQYQKSVFVFPHPCEEEVRGLAIYLKISKHIRFLEVSSMDDENVLKKKFALSKK